MKPAAAVVTALFVLPLLLLPGCDSGSSPPVISAADANSVEGIPMCAYYSPAKIAIMPLTDFAESPPGRKPSELHVYVSLLDAFGTQIKYPAIFDFELYEYVSFAAGNKGRKVQVWKGYDLEDPEVNHETWEDYLRAYVFELPIVPELDRYTLEVTCVCGFGKRLSANFILR